MHKHELLVVDDEAEDLDRCRRFLEEKGYAVTTAKSGMEAISRVKESPSRFSVIVLDFEMPGMNGADTTAELVRINPDLLILIFSGKEYLEAFLLPFRKGACAFVKKGEDEGTDRLEAELALLCARFDETRRTLNQTRSSSENERIIQRVGMVGCSSKLADCAEQVIALQGKEDTVTLMGESGTGKELLAKALHVGTDGPFIGRDCSTIPKETADSVLFGHIRGAFTGAVADAKGLFREFVGGTRFLDDIHELLMSVQMMLLRAIQERKVAPKGSNIEVPFTARLIVGTKPGLAEEVARGNFKLDLLTRLCEAVITVPALRERREDIAPLVEHFCRQWSEKYGIEKKFLTSTLPLLESFPWRGNVRELRSLVRAVNWHTKTKPQVSSSDIEDAIKKGRAIILGHSQKKSSTQSVEKVHRDHFIAVLGVSTSARDAARILGVAPSTVTRFMEREGLDPKTVIGVQRMDGGEGTAT